MSGIASAAAEIYARHNIPSIPLGRNKKPSVQDFTVAELTVPQSMAWFRRRPNAKALGVPDGRLSGIVRLDIDEHGEHVERAVIRRAGDTPFKTRTASQKLHLLYRYNSERRLTGRPGRADARPWDDLKVDLCGGGGYSISPPSQCAGGEYKFLGDVTLEQLLEHRDKLPTIRGLPERAYRAVQTMPVVLPDDIIGNPYADADLRQVHDGSRDAEIWRPIAKVCKRVFLDGGDKEIAMAEAISLNAHFPEPKSESWVAAKVNHWWDLTLQNKNEFGTGHRPRTWMQSLTGDPPMLALLCWLKEQNRPQSKGFMIANGLVGLLGGWWSIPKLREYRHRLCKERWVVQIQRPIKGRAALYVWGPTAFQELFPSDSWGAEIDTLSST
jgi:Bifunctional DNA primase/polymerase, N-terminal